MNNLLQGFGVFVCVGALLLVILAFFAFRALFANRAQNTRINRDVRNMPPTRNPEVFDREGNERPRFDDRDVNTSGGFGNIPSTGARDYPRSRPLHEDNDLNNNGVDDDLERRRAPRRDNEDDVSSRGGFGNS